MSSRGEGQDTVKRMKAKGSGIVTSTLSSNLKDYKHKYTCTTPNSKNDKQALS